MPNIQTIIIDDNDDMINELTNLLGFFQYINIKASFHSFMEAKDLMESETIDLVFLDIMLQNENGIEIAEYMQKKYQNTFVIFITSQPEFALESYKVAPLDFITKPINPIRLENTLNRVKVKIKNEKSYDIQDIRISIKVNSSIQLIEINKIVLIEKNLRKIKIQLSDGSSLSCNETIKMLEKKLHAFGFLALTRTTLVPIKNIAQIKYNKYTKNYTVVLKNGGIVPDISKEKYRILKQLLNEFDWII